MNEKTNIAVTFIMTAVLAVTMTACGNNAKDEIDPLLSQSASETASSSYLDTGSSAAEDTDSETDTGSDIEEKDLPDVDINSVKLSSYAELEVLRCSVGLALAYSRVNTPLV